MGPPPHPLAGKTGEGPPIAPPNWKWRAGNRLSDMYFYSPSGKQFRSRPELSNYLKTLTNPPDTSLFCWRVTDEVLKSGLVDSTPAKTSSKRKARRSLGRGSKRNKAEKSLGQSPSSQVPLPISPVQPTTGNDVPPVDPATSKVPFPRKLSILSSAAKLKGIGRKKGKHVRIRVPHTFKSILGGRSSFSWLYDSDTLEKFLEEARKLKHKSPAEISEMRNVLLGRKLDIVNICKYPNSVIRVFVSLLRNEEPSLSMGKVELADLCVNWICKKRHYWCLLELGRVSSPATKYPKVHMRGEVLGFETSLEQYHVEDGVTKERDRALKLGFLSPNGSGRAVESRTRSGRSADRRDSTLMVEINRKSSLSPRSMIFEGNTRTSHFAAHSMPEGQETSSLQPASDSGSGEIDMTFPAIATLLETAEGLSHRDEGMSDSIMSGGCMQREHQLECGALPLTSILEHGGFSSNIANFAEAMDGFQETEGEGRSNELVYALSNGGAGKVTVETGKSTVAIDMLNCPSVRESASTLDGESIVVITGFKSGVGSVFRRGEEKQFNGGPPATVSHNFMTMSEDTTQVGKGVSASTVNSEVANCDSGNLGSKLNDGAGISLEQNSQRPCSAKSGHVVAQTNQSSSGQPLDELHQSEVPAFEAGGLDEGRKEIFSLSSDMSPSQAQNDMRYSAGGSECLDAKDEGIKMEQSRNGKQEENLPSGPKHFVAGKERSGCWCRICGTDFSFCRGCMCSFCRKTLQPGEDWMVVKCICNHVCHIDCAQASNAAGVVKELGLDGELSCPSCSVKIDLWPYFQKRFDLILSLSEVPNPDVKSLENHLLQAVQLLKGTERKRYKLIEWLVVECYELLQKFSFLALVQRLLHTIRDELYLAPCSGLDLNSVGELSDTPSGDLLKEQDILESLNTARNERLLMEQVVDKVHRAYENALSKREKPSITTVPASMASERPEQNSGMSAPKELLVLQQAKLDCEMQSCGT